MQRWRRAWRQDASSHWRRLNQAIWKICDPQIGSSPQGSGWKQKIYIWNHHLDLLRRMKQTESKIPNILFFGYRNKHLEEKVIKKMYMKKICKTIQTSWFHTQVHYFLLLDSRCLYFVEVTSLIRLQTYLVGIENHTKTTPTNGSDDTTHHACPAPWKDFVLGCSTFRGGEVSRSCLRILLNQKIWRVKCIPENYKVGPLPVISKL